MRNRLLLLVAVVLVAFVGLGCPTSSEPSGGIFGDRPLPDSEEEDTGPRKDASTDAKDAATDRGTDTGDQVDASDDT